VNETFVIDITLNKKYTYSSTFYIDFGNSSWGSKEGYILTRTADGTTYTQVGSWTDWVQSYRCGINAGGTGINYLRIVLKTFYSTQNRIAQIGLINYSSLGVTGIAISQAGCSTISGTLAPYIDNTYQLGTSNYRWKAIYGTTFYGALSGNATSATKLAAACTLTVGSTGKSFDGSKNVSWSLDEIGAAPKSHTHNYLTNGSEGAAANTRTADYTTALTTGGWRTTDAGYLTQYGTTLDISGVSTWYHRLAFNTSGVIEQWQGINTKTMTRVGYIYTSKNIIYSATEPTAPHIGTIWLQPV
jgi:hypothetical protein